MAELTRVLWCTMCFRLFQALLSCWKDGTDYSSKAKLPTDAILMRTERMVRVNPISCRRSTSGVLQIQQRAYGSSFRGPSRLKYENELPACVVDDTLFALFRPGSVQRLAIREFAARCWQLFVRLQYRRPLSHGALVMLADC